MKNLIENTVKPTNKFSSKFVEVAIFGQPINWSLKNIDDPLSDIKNNLCLIAKDYNVQTIYAPNSSQFNAHICEPEDFAKHIFLDDDQNIVIHRACYADGIVIPKEKSMFIGSADCPTIVLHDKENDILIGAHAGLGCLIDRKKIIHNIPTRKNNSVIDQIMRHLPGDRKKTEVIIVCGIKPKNFIYKTNHPTYGEENDKILSELINMYGSNSVPFGKESGAISLNSIIESQLASYGIYSNQILFDGVNTYEDNYDKNPTWWSHVKFSEGKQSIDGRNGIFIVHK